ncbi:MAG TPA: CsgG/HfaB family protein [Longimicrobiales bacterium]|nr:CsgG/HfaB family protein [Longimicrobiales bacterium]
MAAFARSSVRWTVRTTTFTVILAAAGCTSMAAPSVPSPEKVATLEAAHARAPASIDARLHLAAAYDATGRSVESVDLLEPLANANDPDPAALFLFGTSLEKEARFGDAKRAFEAYLAVDAPLPLRREARARIALLERRELEQAVRQAIAQESSLQATTPRDDAVGVFPFLFAGSDPALEPLSRAIAELLTTDLAQTDRLVVLERARLQFLLDELQLAASDAVDPATAARAGRVLGAGRIVQGRIGGDESALQIETAVVRVAGGGPAATLTEDGPIGRLFEMEKQLALSIYGSAGVQLTVAERERVLRRHTDNVQALLAFGFGLEADDGNRFAEAVTAFERALSFDGAFELARIWLERSRRKAEAEAQDIDELTGLGELELGWLLPEWLRRRLLFAAVDPLVPDPDLRNPGPEVLGVEGLDRRARVDVIIRPPGGGQ